MTMNFRLVTRYVLSRGALLAIVLIAVYVNESVRAYQPIIAAIIALVVGLGTILAIMRQIRQSHELAEEHRRRRSYAARAIMPAALAQLGDYA